MTSKIVDVHFVTMMNLFGGEMKDKFTSDVVPLRDTFVSVTLSEEKILKVKRFVQQLIQAKIKERHHIRDPYNEEKRWTTGFGGEAACEKLLNLNIIDWTIGKSSKYHVSDLNPTHNLGIKTVEWGKFHVIFRRSKDPQILVFKMTDREYLICGIASIDILNKHQDLNLILSPSLRAKGTKTAFTGYNHIKTIHKKDDIKQYSLEYIKERAFLDSLSPEPKMVRKKPDLNKLPIWCFEIQRVKSDIKR